MSCRRPDLDIVSNGDTVGFPKVNWTYPLSIFAWSTGYNPINISVTIPPGRWLVQGWIGCEVDKELNWTIARTWNFRKDKFSAKYLGPAIYK